MAVNWKRVAQKAVDIGIDTAKATTRKLEQMTKEQEKAVYKEAKKRGVDVPEHIKEEFKYKYEDLEYAKEEWKYIEEDYHSRYAEARGEYDDYAEIDNDIPEENEELEEIKQLKFQIKEVEKSLVKSLNFVSKKMEESNALFNRTGINESLIFEYSDKAYKGGIEKNQKKVEKYKEKMEYHHKRCQELNNKREKIDLEITDLLGKCADLEKEKNKLKAQLVILVDNKKINSEI